MRYRIYSPISDGSETGARTDTRLLIFNADTNGEIDVDKQHCKQLMPLSVMPLTIDNHCNEAYEGSFATVQKL